MKIVIEFSDNANEYLEADRLKKIIEVHTGFLVDVKLKCIDDEI